MSEIKPDWKNWAKLSEESEVPWRFRGPLRADMDPSREEFIEYVKTQPLFRFKEIRTGQTTGWHLLEECKKTNRYYVCLLENGVAYEANLLMSGYSVFSFPF